MPRRYILPTHLTHADTVLSLGGVGLSARQLLVLLIGGSSCYDAWLRGRLLDHWLVPLGLVLHWCVVLLLVTLTLLVALVQPAGRALESWLLIVLTYWCAPRRFLWRALPTHRTDATETAAEETAPC
jgi:hypothetical protein